jgi:hypothetical protein
LVDSTWTADKPVVKARCCDDEGAKAAAETTRRLARLACKTLMVTVYSARIFASSGEDESLDYKKDLLKKEG